ncbi:MAG TPA: hypothetical protein DCS93_41000 [Microscillaceae bacterium]|nr:hypothetical protein [Microscillaceae bacterium]
MILLNIFKATSTVLSIFVSTWRDMGGDDLAQFKVGLFVTLGLFLVGIVASIIFIRRKPKDKNGKIDAKAYSADQKYTKGPKGVNNFFQDRLK